MLYTTYKNNPFYVLDITTRDSRQKIVQIAEDKSLELDHDICQKARSELTTPKSRLIAELCWFPGISPKRVKDLLSQLELNPYTINDISGLPNLAYANLLQFAIQQIDPQHSDVFASMIEQIVEQTEEMDIHQILRDLNEERSISGFPEITSDSEIEGIISDIKRAYIKTITAKLNEMPANKIVEIMTNITDDSTLGGEIPAPAMIDDLVDDYVIHTQQFLDDESENIAKLIKAITDRASNGEDAITPLVSQLIKITASWDAVAQPIQLSFKTRGIDHEMSHTIGYDIRSLSVDLFNKYDYSEQTKRLNKLLQDYFSELPELLEKVEEDAETLDEIFRERQNQVNKKNNWANEITYSAEIGLVFKDVLSISEKGLQWKGQVFPLESVTRIAWGGTSHSVNGVPTGTTYTISFGNNRSATTVETRRESVYSAFIDKMWRAIGINILTDILSTLKKGESLTFGKATIWDDGITFTKSKFFGSDEKIKLGWDKINVSSANGNFIIRSTDQNKFAIELSYIALYNVHVLEQAIRMFFKNSNARKLSDLLS